MSGKFICNKQNVCLKVDAAWKHSLHALSEQVLADCNEFCRMDTGILRSSSYSASELSNGRLIWNTPYARRMYYTGTPRRDKNPNASLQWCEKAKGSYVNDWSRIAERLIKGE